MRLIDAEALKTRIQKIEAEALEHGFAPEYVCVDLFLDFLDNAPTIEAKPVVHAHWKKPTYISGKVFNICHCSACEGIPCGIDENTKFCPNCGAQMDGTDTNVGSKVEEENG